jgi:uncharacterized protein YkwD
VGAGPCNSGGGSASANRIADDFCAYRADQGLAKMTRNSSIDASAGAWAQQLASSNDKTSPLRHNSNLQHNVQVACSTCTSWAENVAYDEGASPESIWMGWLGSPTHLSNIRSADPGEYGVGVALASDGTLWAVQEFGHYPG